ncbi:MAG: ribbon-helix-helix domain-containing protein [Armatimonadetes bacterium]|nr:ribbon-helix-helix domain-containing protein [Armatimonadota bacterium]
MVRTQVQFTEEQHRRLKAQAYQRGVSISELVREAVDEKLRRRTAVKPTDPTQSAWLALIGCGHDTATDVSTNHDKYLAEIYLADRG